MVYSNEVILCNTRYARYVDINDCSDIDLQDLDLYNKSSKVHKQDYQTLSSRISKIIDIANVDSNYLEIDRNPLGVLIETRNGDRILCRAIDLMYMSRNIFTTVLERQEDETDVWFNYYIYIMGMKYRQDDIYELSHFIQTSSDVLDSGLHKYIQTLDFVDKDDSRIKSNRKYLRREYTRTYKRIISESPNVSHEYQNCKYCECITTSDMRQFVDDYVCNNCYLTRYVDCDVCQQTDIISRVVDATRASNSASKSICEDAEVSICCNTCWDNFYKSCTRCKCIDYIDLDNVRGLDNNEELRLVYQHFRNNASKYSNIFSRTYCHSCATLLLQQYLLNPFRGRDLPRKYGSKSEFNRFVGIESEVISEYDDADDYENNGYIPRHFSVVDDGSLNSGGVEFVTSRPIIGDEVDTALTSLEQINKDEYNSVDESCGIHIHLNAVDFNFIEIKSLLMIMSRIQNAIYESLPEYRSDSNRYCRPINMSAKQIANIKTLPELVTKYYDLADSSINDNKYNEARYLGTNIHARFYMGTIEFRYHEGSINSKPIKHWIRFLNRIMDVSTKLDNKPKLYSKIISKKTHALDILRDVTGMWGAEYIEGRIDNK